MPALQAATADTTLAGGGTSGAAASGFGVDVIAELERIRHNLLALAAIVDEVRARHNTHTHDGAVLAPPVGEQIVSELVVQ